MHHLIRSEKSGLKLGKICGVLYLVSFLEFGQHDDDSDVLFLNHSPEICDRIFKGRLCGDESLLLLETINHTGIYVIGLSRTGDRNKFHPVMVVR